jgi:hypothetical protein
MYAIRIKGTDRYVHKKGAYGNYIQASIEEARTYPTLKGAQVFLRDFIKHTYYLQRVVGVIGTDLEIVELEVKFKQIVS